MKTEKQIRQVALIGGKTLKGKYKDSYTTIATSTDQEGTAEEPSNDEIQFKSDRLVHPDMVQAFKDLAPHLAFLCEQPGLNGHLRLPTNDSASYFESLQDSKAGELLENYQVTEVILKGSGESEAVVLVGNRLLSNAKELSLQTPEMRMADDYEFMDQLQIAIETIKAETVEFLNGKRAPSAQIEIELKEIGSADLPWQTEDEPTSQIGTKASITEFGKIASKMAGEKLPKKVSAKKATPKMKVA